MGDHAKHRFSITVHSDDLAVVYCLRALAKFSQKTGNNQIPWGGTTDDAWRGAQHNVTFRFDSPEYRSDFLNEATRLLDTSRWTTVSASDTDPATPRHR